MPRSARTPREERDRLTRRKSSFGSLVEVVTSSRNSSVGSRISFEISRSCDWRTSRRSCHSSGESGSSRSTASAVSFASAYSPAWKRSQAEARAREKNGRAAARSSSAAPGFPPSSARSARARSSSPSERAIQVSSWGTARFPMARISFSPSARRSGAGSSRSLIARRNSPERTSSAAGPAAAAEPAATDRQTATARRRDARAGILLFFLNLPAACFALECGFTRGPARFFALLLDPPVLTLDEVFTRHVLQAEADLPVLGVDLDVFNINALTDLDDLFRRADFLIRKFRDVEKAFQVLLELHEDSEVGDL